MMISVGVICLIAYCLFLFGIVVLLFPLNDLYPYPILGVNEDQRRAEVIDLLASLTDVVLEKILVNS